MVFLDDEEFNLGKEACLSGGVLMDENYVQVSEKINDIPSTYKEAVNSGQSKHLIEAMD